MYGQLREKFKLTERLLVIVLVLVFIWVCQEIL